MTPNLGASGQDLAAAFSSARGSLGEAVDLVILHNEREVRGRQPRASLNPVTVLLAVAAWERLVADLAALTSGAIWTGPGSTKPPPGAAQLNVALKTLGPASGSQLPQMWRVRIFENYRGKRPTAGRIVHGVDPALAKAVSQWVGLRHAVAHRAFAQHASPASVWNSDADTDTVQAGAARSALSLFIQLVDQTINAVGQEAARQGAKLDVESLRLPPQWFEAEPRTLRGVPAPGVLWDGQLLPR